MAKLFTCPNYYDDEKAMRAVINVLGWRYLKQIRENRSRKKYSGIVGLLTLRESGTTISLNTE
jgi:hypothetical protein